MRTRTTYYRDYGFNEKEEILLKNWCRDVEFTEELLLLECAIESNKSMCNEIYFSIVKGLSFEKLDTKIYMYCLKADFYGYQRKTLAKFRGKLIEKGIYPF